MSKQDIIDQQDKHIMAMRRHISDYRARRDKAINALALLAEGRGRSVSLSENHQHAMQKLAAEPAADIAKMPLRKAP